MDKQERLKARVMAENLRMMATKIENGFPLTEEQKDSLQKLSREIVMLHSNEYIRPLPINDRDEER